jgi:PAS domain S-box-containing protein
MNAKPDPDNSTLPFPDLQFNDLFTLEDMQRLQDLFAEAHNVASIITHPDGTPITNPSNFCHLCNNIIRKTPKGLDNCIKSDATIGRYNPEGPTIQPCLSGGLWDAGASITVGGKHIANWLIGQVRIAQMDEQQIIEYADEIGANKQDFIDALKKTPVMSDDQFEKVARMLFAFANELSENAYRNLQLKLQIAERDKAYQLLQEKEEQSGHISSTIFDVSYSCELDQDRNSSIIWMTGAVQRITGYSIDEIIALKCWGKLVLNEDTDLFRKHVVDLAPGTSSSCELRLKHKNGSVVWVESFAECYSGPGLTDPAKFYGALVDITERKLAERALKESETRFKYIFELSNVPESITLPTGEINVNKAFCDMFGYTEAELKGKKWQEVTFPDEVEIDQALIDSMLRGGKNGARRIKRYLHKDGSILWGDVSYALIRDSDGKPLHFITTIIDVTEHKSAEEALKESVQLFQGLFNASPDAIVLIDPHHPAISWPVVDCNQACCNMNGYTREEMIGKSIDIINVKDGTAEERKAYLDRLRQAGVLHTEAIHLHKDGHVFPVEISTTIVNIGGKEMILGIDRDITERKKMESELIEAKNKAEKSQQQLVARNDELMARNKFIQTILDHLPIGVSLNNIDEGAATYMNQKFQEIYGWSPEEITSISTFFEKVYPDAEYRQAMVNRTMADILSGDPERMHWENVFITRKDGAKRVINAVNIPLPEQNTMVSTVTDITDLHKTQHDLLKAKEKAEESDKLKSAFLANMSHEIRTPLNSIIGFSELLTDSDFGQVERTEFAQIINKSGNNLLSILSDIMDLSKIEAGQVQVMKSTLFVSKLLAEIQQEFLYNAAAKGIELKLDSLNPPTVIINGDETKIRQIIANLINNALKFTHAGYVELGVRILDNQVCFHIKDTGIGIPAEFQQQIFERFRQIESSHNRKYGGNGLGLAISKSLVELLGGKIWVESEINRGTTFYFTVPN